MLELLYYPRSDAPDSRSYFFGGGTLQVVVALKALKPTEEVAVALRLLIYF